MRLLRGGDRVVFEDVEQQVVALTGSRVRLVGPDGTPTAVLLMHLVDSPGFRVVGGTVAAAQAVTALHQLDDLDENVADRARRWERHIVEVETGLPPDVEPGMTPKPEYDPQHRTLRQREAAKAQELTAAGMKTSGVTVQRMRQRYRTGGLRALVDGRSRRATSPVGRADAGVVAAIREALSGEVTQSTGTRQRLRQRVEDILTERHRAGAVWLQSKETFNRLVASLSSGQHTFGAATSRRLGEVRPLASVADDEIGEALKLLWGTAAAVNTWNSRRAGCCPGSAGAGSAVTGGPTVPAWAKRLAVPDSETPARSKMAIDRLIARREVHLREKTLWRMLHETAGRSEEILGVNIEDLDFAGRRCPVKAKGNRTKARRRGQAREDYALETVYWDAGTARLLPRLLKGRTRGPVFITHRRPGPGKVVSPRSVCPDTGLARLSYGQARALLDEHTALRGLGTGGTCTSTATPP
ncbi:hypothetical protein ACH4OY_19030 [Micromonospora rubida]|uniref:Tyr recombinase domain-containing protein n=1 Tax=Micromonospora rubida TaxID=2697657 RepID=A0ABW7SM47_9ACTN